MEFLANNPIIAMMLLCLCNPPGLLFVGLFWLLFSRFNIRNPFTRKDGDL